MLTAAVIFGPGFAQKYDVGVLYVGKFVRLKDGASLGTFEHDVGVLLHASVNYQENPLTEARARRAIRPYVVALSDLRGPRRDRSDRGARPDHCPQLAAPAGRTPGAVRARFHPWSTRTTGRAARRDCRRSRGSSRGGGRDSRIAVDAARAVAQHRAGARLRRRRRCPGTRRVPADCAMYSDRDRGSAVAWARGAQHGVGTGGRPARAHGRARPARERCAIRARPRQGRDRAVAVDPARCGSRAHRAGRDDRVLVRPAAVHVHARTLRLAVGGPGERRGRRGRVHPKRARGIADATRRCRLRERGVLPVRDRRPFDRGSGYRAASGHSVPAHARRTRASRRRRDRPRHPDDALPRRACRRLDQRPGAASQATRLPDRRRRGLSPLRAVSRRRSRPAWASAPRPRSTGFRTARASGVGSCSSPPSPASSISARRCGRS